MLADGGDVAADADPGTGAGLGAVAAGDLELGLGRAEVAFGLVVGERHGQVAGVPQDLLVAVAEPDEQVAGLALFAPGYRAVAGEPAQDRVSPPFGSGSATAAGSDSCLGPGRGGQRC